MSHPHAFRRVRDAISGSSQDLKVTHSSWTNRCDSTYVALFMKPADHRRSLHVSYRKLIPPIEVRGLLNCTVL